MAWSSRQGGGKPTSIPKFDIDAMLKQPRPLPTSRGIPKRSPGQQSGVMTVPYTDMGRLSAHFSLPKQKAIRVSHSDTTSPVKSFNSSSERKEPSSYALEQALARSLSEYESLQRKYTSCHAALQKATVELNDTKRLLETAKNHHYQEKQMLEAKIAREREQVNTIIKDIQDQANERVELVKTQFRDVSKSHFDDLILRERELAHESLQNARHDARQEKQRIENEWRSRLDSTIREERERTEKFVENIEYFSKLDLQQRKHVCLKKVVTKNVIWLSDKYCFCAAIRW